MLKRHQIRQDYYLIINLLCAKRLKDGIVALKTFLSKINCWELQNNLEQIEKTYGYMLKYMQQDIPDPQRKDMYFKLIRDTLNVADQGVYVAFPDTERNSVYLNAVQAINTSKSSQSLHHILMELEAYTENMAVAGLLKTKDGAEKANEIRKRHEETQAALFRIIWATQVWEQEEEDAAKKMLESKLMPIYDLCLTISAVTMSLLEYFDIRKILLLFDAYRHEHNMISQRALVGLVLIFQRYHARMVFYPQITLRLSLLNEDDKFALDLNRVQIQILLSKETEKITKKMQEEIIPEMLKNVNTHNTMRINPDDENEDDDTFNPDWTYNLENSPLADKLREMSELQMEGADVYMSTFSSLKGFPFFQSIQNWFYPFDKQHSIVIKELQNGTTGSHFLDAIFESPFFCDSDKYSFSQILSHMPKAQREHIVRQMLEQSAEILDGDASSSIKSVANKPGIISNLYIQDLYRFFKLYMHRLEFQDVFNEPIKLNDYPVLKEIMYKVELLRSVVHFYFSKKHYAEAAEIYHTLSALEDGNAETYQKLGYCYQKLMEIPQAINAFLKADMLKPDNAWTNKHLASCYRMIKDYPKAIQYYKKVEEVQPENHSLLFNTGSCLVELERYDEALNYFFKLNFIEPENIKAWRAIGWCSFVLKKYDQAMKYYKKIIDKNGVAQDYLNAGHVAWSMGNMKKAIVLYMKSRKLSGNATLFLDLFEKDKEYLIANGIGELNIALVYDLIE